MTDALNYRLLITNGGNQIDIELEDIVPGHLAYLIEYMPVTDKVKSVAINDD